MATRIEEALKKNESLESLSIASIKQEVVKTRPVNQRGRDNLITKSKAQKFKSSENGRKSPSKTGRKSFKVSAQKAVGTKKPKRSVPSKHGNTTMLSKTRKSSVGAKKDTFKGRKSNTAKPTASKLKVVGFRGRSTSGKKESLRSA